MLRPFIPQFGCAVLDFSEPTDAEVKGAVLTRLVQLALRYIWTPFCIEGDPMLHGDGAELMSEVIKRLEREGLARFVPGQIGRKVGSPREATRRRIDPAESENLLAREPPSSPPLTWRRCWGRPSIADTKQHRPWLALLFFSWSGADRPVDKAVATAAERHAVWLAA